MARPRVDAGGGWPAVFYIFKKARQAGGLFRLLHKLRSKNACKTCALGMGGQLGGMVNEQRHFPEVCKKSMQAQAGDMAGAIREDFLARTPVAQLAKMTSAELEALGRIAFPMIARDGDRHYRRISWDEAMTHVAREMMLAGPDEVFVYVSGRSSNEAAFLIQLVTRAYGTNNINNCSFYCHQASGVALGKVYGSGTASIQLDDIAKADLAIVAGANPASNHPRLMTQLLEVRRRGGKVIVVNPLMELGLKKFRIPSDPLSMLRASTMSDLYLQPRVGGDVATFKALLKGVIECGAVDDAYIAAHTTGWDAVRKDIDGSTWDELLAAAQLTRDEVDRAVELIVGAQRGVFMWAMGLTHHINGVDNILALCNLALARGWLGGEGKGLLPIRGHSNVQGVGSMGVVPTLKPSYIERMREHLGIDDPGNTGQDTYASMLAADAGRVKVGILVGGNLYASNPDSIWTARALSKIGTMVTLSTKLNEGHVKARGKTSLILPVLARDEEPQATTQESMFNFVRVSDGGKPNVVGEMRSEVDVIADLAARVLPAVPARFTPDDLKSHAWLRAQIAKVVPGYEAIARVDVDHRHAEFHIDGRTLHAPEFNTPDKRAHFYVTAVPALPTEPDTFSLMTLRSEGQFNTVVYEVEDLYRGNKTRDVVMMAAADALRLNVSEGDRVIVSTAAGEMEVTVAIVEIAPGSLAMYYPEANVLVPRALDDRSKTPAYKNVVARVRAAAAAPVGAVSGSAASEPATTESTPAVAGHA